MGMTIEAIDINRQYPVYQDQILRDLRKKTIAQNDTVGKSLEEQNNSSAYPDELAQQEKGFDIPPQNQTDPIEDPKSYYEGGLDQAERVINNEQLKFDKQPEYNPPSNSSEATGSLTPGGKAPGQSGPPKTFTDADDKTKHSGSTRRDGTTIPAPAGPHAGDLFKIFCDNTIVYAQDQIVKYSNTSGGGSDGTSQAQSYGDDLNKTAEEAVSSGEMSNPVPGGSYNCGDWGDPRSGGRSHQGLDIFADYGTPVYAARDGKVMYSKRVSEDGLSVGYGRAVKLDHGDGLTSAYAHLSELAGLSPGENVKRGQLVGYMGTSGNAVGTDPHVHFEIRHNNVPQPPCNFIK